MNYCDFANNLPEDSDNPNKQYHAEQYGFPIEDDNGLFERLVLEINQAGLSWTLILKKRQAFQTASKPVSRAKSCLSAASIPASAKPSPPAGWRPS